MLIRGLCGAAFVAVLSAAALVADPAPAGSALDRIRERGVMVGATDPEWPPYSWRDEGGAFRGFDIEVTQEIAERLGVAVEFVTPTWDEQTAGGWGDRWDISVGSMSPTTERAKRLAFPAIYAYGLMALAVHSDNSSIRTVPQASRKRISVIKSTIFEMYLRREDMGIEGTAPPVYRIDDPEIVEFLEPGAQIDALLQGDGVVVDALLDDLAVLMALVREGKPVRIVGQPLFAAPSAVAIEPGDPEFAAEIARIVAEMRSDGTLTRLSTKWFDFDLTKPLGGG
jgi:polar amino acid transport system substrate-binding protein